MSTVRASIAVFDQAGDEVAAEGTVRVIPGTDPGTVELWLGDGSAGVVVDDAAALMAALASLPGVGFGPDHLG